MPVTHYLAMRSNAYDTSGAINTEVKVGIIMQNNPLPSELGVFLPIVLSFFVASPNGQWDTDRRQLDMEVATSAESAH